MLLGFAGVSVVFGLSLPRPANFVLLTVEMCSSDVLLYVAVTLAPSQQVRDGRFAQSIKSGAFRGSRLVRSVRLPQNEPTPRSTSRETRSIQRWTESGSLLRCQLPRSTRQGGAVPLPSRHQAVSRRL